MTAGDRAIGVLLLRSADRAVHRGRRAPARQHRPSRRAGAPQRAALRGAHPRLRRAGAPPRTSSCAPRSCARSARWPRGWPTTSTTCSPPSWAAPSSCSQRVAGRRSCASGSRSSSARPWTARRRCAGCRSSRGIRRDQPRGGGRPQPGRPRGARDHRVALAAGAAAAAASSIEVRDRRWPSAAAGGRRPGRAARGHDQPDPQRGGRDAARAARSRLTHARVADEPGRGRRSRDTGVGHSRGTSASKIFDPFFTTKGPQGHRARPVDDLRHPLAPRRAHHGRERGGPGHDLPPALPAAARLAGGRGRAARRGRRRAACRCAAWSWTTRRRWARCSATCSTRPGTRAVVARRRRGGDRALRRRAVRPGVHRPGDARHVGLAGGPRRASDAAPGVPVVLVTGFGGRGVAGGAAAPTAWTWCSPSRSRSRTILRALPRSVRAGEPGGRP